MKKIAINFISIILIASLTACSTSTSSQESDYSIKSAKVIITDSSHLVGETFIKNSKGKKINVKPKALHYEFKVKQNGGEKLYKTDQDEVEALIIPGKNLKKASKDIVGVNIFTTNHEKYGSGMGFYDFDDLKTGKITLTFEVGATKKNNYIPLAPSDDQLKKLKNAARNGTLVLKRNHKEIARYSLTNLKPLPLSASTQ